VAEPALVVLPFLDAFEVLRGAPVVRADLGGGVRGGIPSSIQARLLWRGRWDRSGSVVGGIKSRPPKLHSSTDSLFVRLDSSFVRLFRLRLASDSIYLFIVSRFSGSSFQRDM